MLRIKRLAAQDSAPVWTELREAVVSLIASLPLSPEDKSLIANCEPDGAYLNFTTPLSGTLQEVSCPEGKPMFLQDQEAAVLNFTERQAKWQNALRPYLPPDSQASWSNTALSLNERAALLLSHLVSAPQYLMVLEGREPIIVPFWDRAFIKEAPVAPVAQGAASGGHRLWPWVLLGLLLALVALWFLWGQNWWQEHLQQQARESELSSLKQELVQRQYQLHDINRMLGRVTTNIDTAENHLRQKQLTELYRELEERRTNLIDIYQMLGQVQQKEEEQAAKLAAQEAAEATLAAAKVEAEPVPQDKAKLSTTNSKQNQLPRCTTIVKEGKMPQLILATDGSGSMLEPMTDGSLRIAAAMKAANEVVDSIDRNVPIRLFGIQGCPLARDYGVFSGSQRAALKRSIALTNPLLSPRPLQVLTPLVSALRGMANVAGANNDAVGILISDGLDTCNGTKNVDLCSLAREIHAAKPRLKIHVVLLGDDATSAQCVANITGGKVYRPENARELATSLKQAAQSLVKVCY